MERAARERAAEGGEPGPAGGGDGLSAYSFIVLDNIICEKAIPAARRARFAAFRGPFARLAFHRVFRRSKSRRELARSDNLITCLGGWAVGIPVHSTSIPFSLCTAERVHYIASQRYCFTVFLLYGFAGLPSSPTNY